MIIVKGRELLIPEHERYIGTNYDAGMENRLFRIPRYSPSGTDLSDLTFKINLICDGDPLDRAEMVKVIDDNFIYLTWAVTEEQVRVTGTVFVCVTGNDTNDTVKWSSFQAPFYTEKSLGDDIDTAYHDLVNKVAKEITDRVNAVAAERTARESADAAETSAREAAVSAEATARQAADTTLQQNIDAEATARQAADTTLQQNIDAEAAARAAGDAAANTRIDNIVAQSGDDITEIVDARTGADSTVYASLKARLDAENSNVKSHLNNSVVLTDYTWVIGAIVNGAESGASTRIRSDFIPVTAGSIVTMSGNPNCVTCAYYDENKNYTTANDWASTITVPSGTSYVRIVLRISSSNPTITDSDIPSLVARCALSLTLRQSIYLFDPNQMQSEVKNIYDEKTIERSASGNYYFRFDVKQGETYIVQNMATTGAFTCYTSNINKTGATTNIDTIGTLNAGNSAEFTASQDADFFVGYASTATTIRVVNKNAVIYNLQKAVDQNTDAVEAIGDERVLTRSASGNWYIAFGIKGGTKYKVDNLGESTFACWTSNVTVHNANTDIDSVGAVSGGGSTVFTASDDAKYFVGYASGATTIRIAVYGTAVQKLEEITSATNFLIDPETVANQQIVQNIQGDGLCFALQSDTHFTITDSANYTNVERFARLSRYIAMDFIGNLGDIIRGYEFDDYQMTLNDISYIMYDYLLNKDPNTPFLPVKGNHDDGSLYVYTQNQNDGNYGLSSLVTDARLFAKMYNQMHQLPNYPANVSNPMYYYIDVKDCRIIVLNSIDIELSETDGKMDYYGGWNCFGYGNAQLNWLANVALKTDRRVAVFSHVPLLQTLSANAAENSDVVIGLLNAFINGTSYASSDSTVQSPYADFSYDVSADYSTQGSGVVIGSFSGHTHVEQSVQKDVANNILFPHINIKNGTGNGKVYTVSDDTITEYDINNFASTRVFQF